MWPWPRIIGDGHKDRDSVSCAGLDPLGLFNPIPASVLAKYLPPHPRNPHLPKSPLNRFFIGLTRLRTSMHVCRQQCMRFILRTRRFKDFFKPPLKLNDYEYDMFYKPNVSVYFVLKVLQWWIYWHRLHQFANTVDDKFLRMREEILRRRQRDGSTERLGKSPTNKQIGDDVFLCCTTLTNNMYCRSKARLILTGEVTAKWLWYYRLQNIGRLYK